MTHPQHDAPDDASSESDPILWVIYGAMVSGVLILGAVVGSVMPIGESASEPGLQAWIPAVLAVMAVFVAGFVRGRLPRGAAVQVRRVAAIIVWCFAEGAALFGLVIVLMTGVVYPAGVGALIAFATMAFYHPGRFR